MKICLYSPYIPDHIGGGEKYLLDVARVLAKKHQVVIGVRADRQLTAEVQKKYQQFMGDSLAGVEFVSTPLGTGASFWQKLWWTRQFDVLYYATDGSLFFSLAGKNIVHIQIPLRLDKSSSWEQFKLRQWDVKNTNSEFTRSIVEPSWPVKIDLVHYPLVELQGEAKADSIVERPAKEKIILNVGRFFRQLHSKRQDVLVKAFAELVAAEPKLTKGWKLVLVGNVEDETYAAEVAEAAESLPIEIHHQVTRAELMDWYRRASIYWHAAGFGVDQEKYPEKVEHFGISTAEAMLAECVPVVVGKGGQVEVVGEQLQDWLWQTEAECVEKTATLLDDPQLRHELGNVARKQASQFNAEHFEEKLWSMMG